MPGPAPKRPEERRRRNAVAGGERTLTLAEATPVPAGLPALPRGAAWHPLVREYYESVRESGQSRFFEPSDWAALAQVCFAMHKLNTGKRFGAELFAQVWKAMADLESTDVARRKAHIFITRPVPGADLPGDASKPTALDQYRKALG